MRPILLFALGLLPALACRQVSTSIEQPEPASDAQTIVAPELQGAAAPTCDGTNAAIIWRDGKYETIPMAAFEDIYSLKRRKYEDRGHDIPDTADARYRKSISERLIHQRLLELECQLAGVDYDEAKLADRVAAQGKGSRTGRSTCVDGARPKLACVICTSPSYEVRIRASHILVEVTDSAGEAAALARAEELYARASNGEDFAELARAESNGPNAVDGGDLGIFASDKMVKEFSTAAFKLKPVRSPSRCGPSSAITSSPCSDAIHRASFRSKRSSVTS